MASSHAPKNSSATNKPHTSFFRVVLPHILEQKKLKLPVKFVRRYGSEISSAAKLYLPNGYAWKVGVVKRKEDGNKEEEVWLTDGWGEFMDHHSISAGCFVVFKYRAHSAFDVEIFNLTTCSITYPPPPRQNNGFASKEEIRNNVHFLDLIAISDDESEDELGSEMAKMAERLEASGIATTRGFYKWMRELYMKCKKGIEEAIRLASNNPAPHPSFIILLTSHQIQGTCRPVMPISFARQHIPSSTSVVVLQSSGKEWRVAVEKDRRVKSGGDISSASFGKGWRQFKEDNNLGVGDVCLFQLVPPQDLAVMDVSIFPAQ